MDACEKERPIHLDCFFFSKKHNCLLIKTTERRLCAYAVEAIVL